MDLLHSSIVEAKRYERTPYEACPLCSSKNFAPLKSADCQRHALYRAGLPTRMHWVRCAECQHVFADGYFSGDALAFLFGATQESQTPGYNVEAGRVVAAEMIERFTTATGIRSGRWLDVGFGAGHLLTTAHEYGFDVTGLELRESSCWPLRALSYDVRSESLLNLCEPDKGMQGPAFSAISMADVLEHMPFPREALLKARKLMAIDGALFVSMPNVDSFVWRALDIANANPYWGELEHFHNFGRESLYWLLRETGFEPISYFASRRYRACMEVIAKPN